MTSRSASSFRHYVRILALIFLFSFATERQAHAYTDPGSGALIWQLLAASLLAIPFYFRKVVLWVKKKVKKQ